MAINLPTSNIRYFPGVFPAQGPQPEKVTRIDRQLTRQAKTLIEQGNYGEALEILTPLIEADPHCAEHYNNRGYAYFQSEKLELAIADYNQAISIDPEFIEAHNNRGNAYARQGDLYAALLDYDQTIDLNPFKIEAWINRGVTFRQLKIYELALDNFDFALRMGRLEGYVYAERGRTYHKIGDWNWAIADYQRAIACFQNPEKLSHAENRQYKRVLSWLDELLQPLK